MRAVMIGAGIGGLTTALRLHAADIDVEVAEYKRIAGFDRDVLNRLAG